jgi:rhodanese-related sulfurtransferase
VLIAVAMQQVCRATALPPDNEGVIIMSKKSHAAGRKQPLQPRPRIPLLAIIAGVILMAVVAFAAIILLQGANTATTQPLPPEINVTEAATKRDAGAFLLDVREPSEWAAAHLSGATLIPLGQLPSRLSEVPKDKDVVVMCRTGHRSAQGRDILLQAGYKRVTSVAGGITAWSAQGLPTVQGQ